MIRTGIIGCGKVGHLHAKALTNLDQTDFVAVWSRTRSSAKSFANKYNVKPYEDISQMIRENELDLVIICTPHPYHVQPTVSALKAGAHVLIEKPMTADSRSAEAIVAKAAAKNIGVTTPYCWRYHPVLNCY